MKRYNDGIGAGRQLSGSRQVCPDSSFFRTWMGISNNAIVLRCGV